MARRTVRVLALSLLVLPFAVYASGGKEAAGAQPRVTIKFLYTDSGIIKPEDVDRDNSEWVKMIEDFANVKLEIENPPYKDFATRYQLVLASGNIPDLVHTSLDADTAKAARQGAFIDLKPYYDKAVLVKKWITPDIMENIKDAETGKYYKIPMGYNQKVAGGENVGRWDMLKKHNGGNYPASVEEWIAFLRKIKQIYPDSIPLSARISWFFGYGDAFYAWYGARVHEWQVRGGKVINTFTLPEFAQATEVYRTLYKDGIFDKEWVTNDGQKAMQKLEFNNWVLRGTMAIEDILSYQQNAMQKKGGWLDQRWVQLPPLKSYPASVSDSRYTNGHGALKYFTSHGLWISSTSKNPQKAFDVIEGLSQDRLYEAVFWGKEGEEYTVKDGIRIPNPEKLADPKRWWSLQLAMVFGWNWSAEVDLAVCNAIWGNEDFKQFTGGIDAVHERAVKRGPYFMSVMPPNDEVSKVAPEATSFIEQAVTKAILGQIGMDEFRAMQAQYGEKYGKRLSEIYTAELQKNKDKWLQMGMNEVGW